MEEGSESRWVERTGIGARFARGGRMYGDGISYLSIMVFELGSPTAACDRQLGSASRFTRDGSFERH